MEAGNLTFEEEAVDGEEEGPPSGKKRVYKLLLDSHTSKTIDSDDNDKKDKKDKKNKNKKAKTCSVVSGSFELAPIKKSSNDSTEGGLFELSF